LGVERQFEIKTLQKGRFSSGETGKTPLSTSPIAKPQIESFQKTYGAEAWFMPMIGK
tara:strand:- start:4212 stop:4382 length:171 start_codon:yes stop_codon:yes gene_type:complete